MKRILCIAAACSLCAPVLAGSVHEAVIVGHLIYDMKSGEIRRADGSQYGKGGCWSSVCESGYFVAAESFEVMLDWGDADNDCLGAITSFQISYASNHAAPQSIDIIFNSSDNGFCDVGRTSEVAFRLTGLPGQGPYPYTGWIVTVLPVSPIDLSSSADLDGDGLGDFSYSYYFRTPHDGVSEITGPLLAGPLSCGSTGQEDAYDLFVADPDSSIDPNDLLIPDVNAICDGTYWFGGPPAPFAGLHMALGDSSCANTCPPPGGPLPLTQAYLIEGNADGNDWSWRFTQPNEFCITDPCVSGVAPTDDLDNDGYFGTPADVAKRFADSINIASIAYGCGTRLVANFLPLPGTGAPTGAVLFISTATPPRTRNSSSGPATIPRAKSRRRRRRPASFIRRFSEFTRGRTATGMAGTMRSKCCSGCSPTSTRTACPIRVR